MPKHWIRIENGWNPHPEVYDFQEEIYRIVNAGNGGLDDLLSKPGTRQWYVIVHAITGTTDYDAIFEGLREAGYKPELLERDLETPEEASIRLSGTST